MKTETVIGFKNDEVRTLNKVCDFVTESLGRCFCTCSSSMDTDPVLSLDKESVDELYKFVQALKKEVNKE
jgi:hypothetical protein